MEGGYRALVSLREQGVVRAIGCGLNEWQACQDFAEAGDFDCFLLAGRYTLLDAGANAELLPLCEEKGISVIAGGVFNSGILASGDGSGRYDYGPAAPELADRVRALASVCARWDVPLQAAALQFPLGHPAVACVIVGCRSAGEIEEDARLFELELPPELWDELRAEQLLPADAPVPAP
jgi:D-threo-aldose 1-dehydrogenase